MLAEIHVTGAGGKLVPLSTFATLRTSTQPRELRRFQQLNAVRVQGILPPGVPLDTALTLLEQEAARLLPPGWALAGRLLWLILIAWRDCFLDCHL